VASLPQVRAPELRGRGGWINTDRPLRLADLRGRVVLLDFWTFCCINCIHVIEELRPLEERFGDSLVVIGVHSPKFPHEQDHAAVERAVRRHRIHHPVLDDPDMETWESYAVRAWPTLVVIDPAGKVAAMASGEGHGAAVAGIVADLLERVDPAPGPAFTAPRGEPDGLLAFPGKVASDGAGRIAIADTGHDRVLVATLGGALQLVAGGFSQPQGVRFDGDRLLVCDTVAGRLVAVDLDGGVQTELVTGISSPWDVVRQGDDLLVAEAGHHRILAVPAAGGPARALAGSGAEGLRDGPALDAQLAQPSGLAVLPGGALAIADSEVSALRVLEGGAMRTLVGEGLFDWTELQHPLGVAAAGPGIAIADTFNGRLRVWTGDRLDTPALDTELDEPGGLDTLPDGRLLVADTGHHRILVADLATGTAEEIILTEAEPPLEGEAAGRVALPIRLDLGDEGLDETGGPPVRITVSAEPGSLLGPGPRSWALAEVPDHIEVQLGLAGSGDLIVDVVAATCHGDVCSIRRSTVRHDLTVG
jgi:thiol-disulfide isomerase/thioredoxin